MRFRAHELLLEGAGIAPRHGECQRRKSNYSNLSVARNHMVDQADVRQGTSIDTRFL